MTRGASTRVAAGRCAGVLTALLVCAAAASAWAYEFTLDLRTIGQGYQVRRYDRTGATELLTRRRLTQYLNLGVYGLAPERWRERSGGSDEIHFEMSLRFDADFGSFMEGRPSGADTIRELEPNRVDILYAYFAGHVLRGRLEFQLGRQIHFDLVDFFAFDGARLALRTIGPVILEGFAGTEVRGELPLSTPLYALDGTSAGDRDPATRPGQAEMTRPMAGAAIALEEVGLGHARLAYRRVWSSTADRLPGEPGSGVNDEKISLTADAHAGPVFVWLGARYNLLVGRVDDQQLAVRVPLPARQAVTAEHAFLAPTFDGDSIWNIFATGAYRDLRLGYDVAVGPEVRAHARGFMRFFELGPGEAAGGDEAPGGRTAAGGNAGVVWRRDRSSLRFDGYAERGYGGRKIGGVISGRLAIDPRVWLVDARVTVMDWRSDLQPETNDGVAVGLQAGSRYELAPGMRVHLLAEDNMGTFYRTQFRALAMLEVDASL